LVVKGLCAQNVKKGGITSNFARYIPPPSQRRDRCRPVAPQLESVWEEAKAALREAPPRAVHAQGTTHLLPPPQPCPPGAKFLAETLRADPTGPAAAGDEALAAWLDRIVFETGPCPLMPSRAQWLGDGSGVTQVQKRKGRKRKIAQIGDLPFGDISTAVFDALSFWKGFVVHDHGAVYRNGLDLCVCEVKYRDEISFNKKEPNMNNF